MTHVKLAKTRGHSVGHDHNKHSYDSQNHIFLYLFFTKLHITEQDDQIFAQLLHFETFIVFKLMTR